MTHNISFVLTSCGRFDLLEQTIASMEPWVFDFAEKIVIDDSGRPHEVLDKLQERGFLVLSNSTRKGQHYSIDRAYSQATCPYIFHCQDDWMFDQCPNLDLARYILDINPRLSQVCFSDFEAGHKTKYPHDYKRRLDAMKFTVVDYNGVTWRYPAFSLSRKRPASRSYPFTPHLIKRTTVDRFFPYSQYFAEYDLAREAQWQGYTVVYQSPGTCVHIGVGHHHVSDPRKYPLRRAWHRLRGFLRYG